MGNDSSKQQLHPNPRGVHRRLSTDSARRYRATIPTPQPVQASISCSDGFLSPSDRLNDASSSSSRLSIDGSRHSNDGNSGNSTSRLSIDAGSDCSRSRSGSITSERSNSIKKKHPILSKNRQLIQSCFLNPHEMVGKKIIKRTAKNGDFAVFYSSLNSEQKDELENGVKVLLKSAANSIDYLSEVEQMAEDFGLRLVLFRSAGFKADYFAAIADSTIQECSFLDNAVHPAHQTGQAFSQFVGIVFTSVRNGFYNEMRRQRRASHSFSTGQTVGTDRRPKLSVSASSASRSNKPKLLKEFYSPTLLVNGNDPFLKAPNNAFF